MAGANPQRTSWVPVGPRGNLAAEWAKPIEPYISQKVQIIGAEGKVFVSTARGLYALNADSGAEVWVYPTNMPLGHSPTYADGVLYVGGFDRKLHAIDAANGAGIWQFTANAGFHTNPLVVGDKIYAGNRDGYLYAIYAQGSPAAGELAWKFQTDGPILFSAAYQDGVIYFPSNDSYVYALNAETGALIWKTRLIPFLVARNLS
jgi:outer membrane protein assembly factor BamB